MHECFSTEFVETNSFCNTGLLHVSPNVRRDPSHYSMLTVANSMTWVTLTKLQLGNRGGLSKTIHVSGGSQ